MCQYLKLAETVTEIEEGNELRFLLR